MPAPFRFVRGLRFPDTLRLHISRFFIGKFPGGYRLFKEKFRQFGLIGFNNDHGRCRSLLRGGTREKMIRCHPAPDRRFHARLMFMGYRILPDVMLACRYDQFDELFDPEIALVPPVFARPLGEDKVSVPRVRKGAGLGEDEGYHRLSRRNPAAFYGDHLSEGDGAGFEAGVPVVYKDDPLIGEQYIVQAFVYADAVGGKDDRFAAVQVIVAHGLQRLFHSFLLSGQICFLGVRVFPCEHGILEYP
jgi:hypothetical protein